MRYAYEPDIRDFYKRFFLCRRMDRSAPVPGAETGEADFFARDSLPPLSTGRVIADDIEAAFEFHDGPRLMTRFD